MEWKKIDNWYEMNLIGQISKSWWLMTKEWSGDMNKKLYWNLHLRDSENWTHNGEWGKENLVADLGKKIMY